MGRLREAIDSAVSSGQPAATKNRLRGLLAFSDAKVKMLVEVLIQNGSLEEHSWKKEVGKGAMREVTGYRRAEGARPQQ